MHMHRRVRPHELSGEAGALYPFGGQCDEAMSTLRNPEVRCIDQISRHPVPDRAELPSHSFESSISTDARNILKNNDSRKEDSDEAPGLIYQIVHGMLDVARAERREALTRWARLEEVELSGFKTHEIEQVPRLDALDVRLDEIHVGVIASVCLRGPPVPLDGA
jgi:hypothetical protein